MSIDLNKLKNEQIEIATWLSTAYKSISTGMASPSVLDGVSIEQYGSWTAIAHTAAVSIEDAKTLRVVPWDKSVLKDIEKAIYAADLGLSVSVDSDGIRVHFPMLTGETRVKLVKVLKDRLEEARVKIRSVREEANKIIDQASKDGEFGDDDKKRHRDSVQKSTDEANANLESIFLKKEADVLGE